MRKLFTVCALLTVIGTANIFAFGIGAQIGWNKNIPGQAAVTFKVDALPLVFAANAYAGNDAWAIGGTADYWFLNNKLGTHTCWYIGAGAGTIFGNNTDNDTFFNLVARMPVGFNWFLAKGLIELYVQGVPQIGLQFAPSFGLGGFDIDVAGGVRFWIK